jgi:hypothetical protein
MARRAGGLYLTAAKPEALMPELRSAVYRTPSEFTIVDKGGRQVARGAFGESAKLQEGQYKLRTVFAGQQFEEAFWVNTDSVTGVTFDATKVRPGAGTPVPAQPVAQQPSAQPGRPMTPAAGP